MEDTVGKYWHKLIWRIATGDQAAVALSLEEVRHGVGIMFRALGHDGVLNVDAATAAAHGARRGWWQRIAGAGASVELAWRDETTLRLPSRIAVFPERELNRDLYFWYAALAAADYGRRAPGDDTWFARSQSLVLHALALFPGMRGRYRRLVTAQLALRPLPAELRPREREQELAIQAALQTPGSVAEMPVAAVAPQPVHLWLHPAPPVQCAVPRPDGGGDGDGGESRDGDERKRRGEQVESRRENDGLIALRMENILTWSEFVNVDRTEEEDDTDADSAAESMDVMSVTRDSKRVASRLRFDLDLPTAAYDDICLGEGIALPEWDFKKRLLRPDYCRLQRMTARDAQPQRLPERLSQTARRLRSQFEALVQNRIWLRGLPDGSEVDLDAYLRFVTERAASGIREPAGLYREYRRSQRDLACLLLADLSLSTDAAVNMETRVIDVIRDSLFLFAEALSVVGDRFAMYGFSSRRRSHVRFHTIKEFDDSYNDMTRGRIAAVRPGYYTRMGAALRYATALLERQRAGRQLLLILTDGKPNDLDQYEGRYGIEDTRHALHEARKKGLTPFCVTIDRKAGDYLPHLFGPGNYVVIRRPDELPQQLPLLYARLTA